MALKYEVTQQYLEHDGGSKFYETVVAHETADPSRAMLIQRWGKVAQNTGGGQIKITSGTYRQMMEEARKITDDKRKYKSGKGQYKDEACPRFGFGRAGIHYDFGEFHIAAGEHYGIEKSRDLLAYFSIITDSTSVEIVEEGFEEAVERGANWGAW